MTIFGMPENRIHVQVKDPKSGKSRTCTIYDSDLDTVYRWIESLFRKKTKHS